MRIFLSILFSGLMSGLSMAQTTVTGYQQRVPGSNAELLCDGIRVDRAMRIDSVAGFHNGFWIVKGTKTEKAFWTERYVPNAIGYVLKSGTFYVYPNLRQGSDTASVTIWLKKN